MSTTFTGLSSTQLPLSRNDRIPPRLKSWIAEQNIPHAVVADLLLRVAERPLSIQDFQGAAQPALFTEYPLRPRQNALARMLSESRRTVVPAWVALEADWDALQKQRRTLRTVSQTPPAASLLIAWHAIQAMRAHPLFRSALLADYVVRKYCTPVVGLAIALPDDELATVAIPDCPDLPAFRDSFERAVNGWPGESAACTPPQLHFSYMAHSGISDAGPVVVPPAVTTLFAGSPFRAAAAHGAEIVWTRRFRLVLAFDHRIINGAAAALFLKEVASRVAA